MNHHLPPRELVLLDPASSLHVNQHDVPHPLAKWHYHPEGELHAITASQGTAMIGSQLLRFEAGDVFLVGSGVPHNWISDIPPGGRVPGRDLLAHYEPDLITALIDVAPDFAALTELEQHSREGVLFRGTSARRCVDLLLRMKEQVGALRLVAFAEALAVLAEAPSHERRVLNPGNAWVPRAIGERDAQRFNKILQHLHANHTGPVGLEEVARIIGVSPAHASRLVTKATSVPLSRIIIRMRVSTASALIRTTNKAMADICFEAGFSSLSNFNRRFKEETGMTPTAYRASAPPRAGS